MQNPLLGPADVLRKLNGKFSTNLDQALRIASSELEMVDISARALAECGSILAKTDKLTAAQAQLCAATEEIFADVITSVYLSAAGLDVPAQMVIRRAFELGLAVVYLWDLPHMYWGWKECDVDLTFTEMLDHLSRSDYLIYVRRTAGMGASEMLIDASAARRIYRKTSNTVHGKITTHKVLVEDGYALSTPQWTEHLALVREVTTIVLNLWLQRFPYIKDLLREQLPASENVTV